MTGKSILPKFAFSPIECNGEHSTENVQLAATIYAFDVPLRKENPWTTQAGDGIKGIRATWHFDQTDLAGNSPKEIGKRWNDPAWLAANRNEALATIKRSFEWLESMKRMIELGRGLSECYSPCVAITNTRKAAVLAGMDHKLIGWRRNDRVTTWCFHEAAATDAALYDDPTLYTKLPDAVISYAKAAILGHECMVRTIKEIQYARVEHKGRALLVGKDASKDTIDKLEKLLYRK